MVWTEITRRHYKRGGLRYESDTTDAEWFVMEPLLPRASALGHQGFAARPHAISTSAQLTAAKRSNLNGRPGVVIRRRQTSSSRTIVSKRRCRMTICSRSTRRTMSSGSALIGLVVDAW